MRTINNEIIIKELNTSLNQFERENLSKLLMYKKELDKAFHSVDGVIDSWSGSWIGFHSSLYYRDYVKPDWKNQFDSEWGSINGIPDDWIERSYEEILDYANSHYHGTPIETIEEYVDSLMDAVKDVRDKVTNDLINSLERKIIKNFEPKLKEINDIKWGSSTTEFIRAVTPTQVVSRDSFALHQGLIPPPHISFQSSILATKSKIEDIEKFIKLTNNLIRGIIIKTNIDIDNQANIPMDRIKIILNRFSVVVMQLKDRYNERPTFEINDEYDVQDLLHSLLKVDFDDIRPEEWTPSYAGSSTRMDFLLKNEQIVIETKMTRKGLNDKQVGEELIVDRAHYKNHSNCKRLVCFVYDPEHRIKNPRGIEKDLAETNDIEVEVFIRS